MNTKISNKGFASIIFFSAQAMFLGVGIPQILNSSKQSSIFSILLGSIIGIIVLGFFIKLYDYEKDFDIFHKIEKIYGKNIGNIINFILIILFLVYFIYTLWSMQIYIQNKYLDKTPAIIILILFLLPIVYAVNKGIKAISKVSLFLFFISIIEILLSIFGLTNFIEFDNFKPFFNNSIFSVIKDAIYFASYSLTPTFLMYIIPKNNIGNCNLFNKNLYKFYIFLCIDFFLLFTFLIGIFGIDLAKLFYYPEFTLIKKINYFNFIQHIENILSTQWMFSLYITATMCLLFIKKYLNNKKLDKKYIYYPIILISLVISTILFKDTTIGFQITKNYYVYIYTIPIILLIIISLIIIKIKKSK